MMYITVTMPLIVRVANTYKLSSTVKTVQELTIQNMLKIFMNPIIANTPNVPITVIIAIM